MNKGQVYAQNLQLDFFASPDFEPTNKAEPAKNAEIIGRNILRLLMLGWRDNWRALGSWQVFKAFFIRRDPEVLRGMRLAFQQVFDRIFQQLNDGRFLDQQQVNQALLCISNCMTLLPFAGLKPDESFAIPQYIDDRWVRVDYKVVDSIELTPTKGLSKLFINESDRVYAYGLEPIANSAAEPHLIFMGTTYPAGQGFGMQLYANREGFATPGELLYRTGREKIIQWLEKQNNKVHVCGERLGGSLSLLLAIDQGDRLSRVDALTSVGLYDSWFRYKYDDWNLHAEKPEVFIQNLQRQKKKLVSEFGIWKPEWNILHVIPPVDKQGLNRFVDQKLNYAGFAETTFLKVDTEEDNQERKRRHFWIFTFAHILLFYFIQVPYRYIVLPIINYVFTHKLLLAITLALVLTSLLMPTIAPALTPPVLLIAALTPLAINLTYQLYKALRVVFGSKESKIAECHRPDLPRNESMDIYKNKISAYFTYRQIQEYYWAKRCILKGKYLMPKESALPLAGKINKQEILEKAAQSKFANERVKVTVSKAKMHDMEKTLASLCRHGFYSGDFSEKDFKEELIQQNRDYKLGKRV